MIVVKQHGYFTGRQVRIQRLELIISSKNRRQGLGLVIVKDRLKVRIEEMG